MKKLAIFSLALVLALTVACNTKWTSIAVDILDAALPTIHNITPQFEEPVSVVVTGLQAWKGDAGALANIASEIQVLEDKLDAVFPNLNAQQQKDAIWIGSGFESVLLVIQNHIPPAAAPVAHARAARAHSNLGALTGYPSASAYRAAKP